MDKCVTLWKEKSSLIEILESFISILKHITKYNATVAGPILTKFTRLHANLVKDRKPLTLQHHKAMPLPLLHLNSKRISTLIRNLMMLIENVKN